MFSSRQCFQNRRQVPLSLRARVVGKFVPLMKVSWNTPEFVSSVEAIRSPTTSPSADRSLQEVVKSFCRNYMPELLSRDDLAAMLREGDAFLGSSTSLHRTRETCSISVETALVTTLDKHSTIATGSLGIFRICRALGLRSRRLQESTLDQRVVKGFTPRESFAIDSSWQP